MLKFALHRGTRRVKPLPPIVAAAAAAFLVIATGCPAVTRALGGSSSDNGAEDVPGSEWPYYNGTLDGQRFSPLAQINATNAGSLTEVCRLRVADQGSFEAGLLVVGDAMYGTVVNDTFALDAATCKLKWRHSYHRSQSPLLSINRGVAYANGRLFRGTDDGRLLALDAQTGAVIWTDVIGDTHHGEYISSAPLAWNGLVFTGTAAGELGIRGRVLAIDAATGRELWTFHTIPLEKEVGADSWINTKWNLHGGGGTWSTFTLDVSSRELFIPVGNPVPDFTPGDRPGQNLFSNCVVVLDALTGAVKWWYQTKTNDPQDNDLAAAPLLYRNADGAERVAAAGKDGYLHIVDRDTHERVSRTAITTVDTVQKQPSTSGVRMCPGPAGGVEWNGPGFDPKNQLLFVGSVDYCAIFTSQPGASFSPGGLNYGGTWSPTSDVGTGWIYAVDANNGAVRWKYHASAPVLSGITPTSGGVVFAGDNEGNFLVFESTTGRILKKVATGGSLSGGVITYLENGRQLVAFTSGNISRTIFGAVGRPTVVIMALPDSAMTQAASAQGTEVDRGRQVFLGLCAGCHGTDGKTIAMQGRDLTTVKNRMSVDQIVAWIRNPKPPMPRVFPEPPEPAEAADLRAVATFVHEWPK